ncbi:hypothetical protein C8A00DRAFT_46131 [Chaetomidium leptoderma]|uniref:Rhodopsin domain-containing protein n=1 Tax=Chaetomidium leptoderma TaxID=669021 RepID=A0AAN6VFT8_9PEZI|nr:hypothetical protein C8A00DRAFT_46131 [Chaetomidium leptoderma]
MGRLLFRQLTSPLPNPLQHGHGTAGIDTSDYCTRRLAGLETGPIPNIGPGASAAIWPLVAISTTFLVLRIYCKIWRSRGIWWDDLTMFLTASALCQRVINLGFGKYPCDIPPANLRRIAFEGGGLGSAFTICAVMWSKTSFGITAVFVWVKCEPVERDWMPAAAAGPGAGEGGRCWDLRVSNGYGMKRKEKVGVVVAMSMGVFAGATAFVKAGMLLGLGSKSFTHDGCHLITWAAAEIATTIMASCIPVLRVLFRDLSDTIPTEIYRQSDSTGGTSKGRHRNSTAPSQQKDLGAKTRSKSWTPYWDSRNGSNGKNKAAEDTSAIKGPTTLYPLAENSSQRVLVHISGESTPGETATRTEGVIVQTQKFEVQYEGTTESAAGYELGTRVRSGVAR